MRNTLMGSRVGVISESVNGSKAGPKNAFRFKLKPKPAVERFSKEING